MVTNTEVVQKNLYAKLGVIRDVEDEPFGTGSQKKNSYSYKIPYIWKFYSRKDKIRSQRSRQTFSLLRWTTYLGPGWQHGSTLGRSRDVTGCVVWTLRDTFHSEVVLSTMGHSRPWCWRTRVTFGLKIESRMVDHTWVIYENLLIYYIDYII